MKNFIKGVLVGMALLLCGGASAKDDNVKIVTLNVRIQTSTDTGDLKWEARRKPCVKAIKKNNPDVFGLQEAFYEHKSYIDKGLKGFQIVDSGEKPGDIGEDGKFNQNPIFFKTERLELLDYGSFFLNENQTPDKKGWDAAYVRNVNWVKLKIKKSGKIFFCFNTHLDDQGETAREESADLIVRKIKQIAGDDAVVFLFGDFNTTSSNKALSPIHEYMKEAFLSVKKATKVLSFNNFGNKTNYSSSIDHIFWRGARIKGYDVDDSHKYGVKYISDHYPVISEFGF